MNTQTPFTRPVKTAVLSFIGLTAVAMAFAAARKMGVIEPAVATRAIGLVIGLMVVVTGNLLPKMRPLNSPRGNPAKVTAAERFAGWILVLAGIAYLALFLFAPLDQALPVSSIIGMGALVVIAANWMWLARGALFRGRQKAEGTVALSERAAEKRKLVIWLLFAFFYVVATACVAFLFGQKPWVHELALWMVVGFGMIYAALYAVLESKRSAE